MSHTRTPWTIDEDGQWRGADGSAVNPFSDEDTEAFIFTAANAHDELVAALAEYAVLGKGKCSIGQATVDKAVAALAKAGVA